MGGGGSTQAAPVPPPPSVPPAATRLALRANTEAVNDSNKFANSAMLQVAALQALPIKKLFSAPFTAAIDAQKIMSEATAYFIQEMGVDARGDMYSFTSTAYYDIPPANVKDASGNQAYYLYQRADDASIPCLDPSGVGVNNRPGGAKKFTGCEGTYEVSGNKIAVDHSGRIIGSQGQRSITLPFLSILNVPALSMQEVTIDFKMEIKTSYQSTADNSLNSIQVANTGNWNTDAPAGSSRGSWYGATTTAAVSNSKTATDKSSSASVYQVHMSAKHKVPVGMSMMLDFMTNNISDGSPQMKVSSDGYSTQQDPKSNILVQMGKI